MDIFGFVTNKSGRLVNKLCQRFSNRTLLHESPNHAFLRDRTRKSRNLHVALAALKRIGMLNREIKVSAIPDAFLGRVVTIGMLVAMLDKTVLSPMRSVKARR